MILIRVSFILAMLMSQYVLTCAVFYAVFVFFDYASRGWMLHDTLMPNIDYIVYRGFFIKETFLVALAIIIVCALVDIIMYIVGQINKARARGVYKDMPEPEEEDQGVDK